jgi:hypothetical protein
MMTQVTMCEDHPGDMKGQMLIYNVAWLKSSQIADEADYHGWHYHSALTNDVEQLMVERAKKGTS